MDDIEDIAATVGPSRVPSSSRGVAYRPRRREGNDPAPPRDGSDADVPGCASIYVKTYGCSHNASDGEYMSGLLQQYGYDLTDEPARADLWLINSCTVKNPSQEHMATDLERGAASGKKLVVAGCVSQAEPDLAALAGTSLVGVQQIDRVVEVVQETLRGNTVRLMGRSTRPSLDLPKVRRNPLVEIIACNTGCLGSCTYCKTVYARGRLGSYEPPALLSRLQSSVSEGVVEVWLTSEDTGAYGRDIGSSMPELMRTLLSGVPDGRMLRVGMTNPPYMLEHIDEIAELLNHPRCYAFLHIPVQSGSDAVLGAMRREYTSAEFRRVADTLLAKVPGITIATDIICGFPGETEADHAATLRLVREYRFPVVNISQFYPRPGTPAARMKRVPTHVVKERTREVSAAFRSYEPYAELLHTEQRVLVADVATDRKHLVGHTKGYAQVLLPPDPKLMGCTLLVRITEAAKFYVRGEVVRLLHPAPNPELAASVLVGGRALKVTVAAAAEVEAEAKAEPGEEGTSDARARWRRRISGDGDVACGGKRVAAPSTAGECDDSGCGQSCQCTGGAACGPEPCASAALKAGEAMAVTTEAWGGGSAIAVAIGITALAAAAGAMLVAGVVRMRGASSAARWQR